VQRGVGDGHAAHADRLQPRHGGEFAGAAHLHIHAQEHGGHFLRRVFVRHGPARLAGDKAQLLLQRQGIDFVNHAINLIGQAAALLPQALVKRHQFNSTLRNTDLPATGKPQFFNCCNSA